MNFQQLRFVREAARNRFNLTEVAAALHTSQPGVSRQIGELESELGVDIFVRSGKRLTGLTPLGETLLPFVDRILHDAENLKRIGDDYSNRLDGKLSVAATHSQARYALPHAVRDFRAMFPQVTLHLHQGSPKQVAEMLLHSEADIGVATEALALYPQLVTLPCYRWTHSIIVPPQHPLLLVDGVVSLEQLAAYPIITYEQGYTGRSHIDQAFKLAGLETDVVLTAMDADVIKTYVELGMGVGIVASIALDAERDTGLKIIDAGHLFAINQTRLAVRQGNWLRGFAYRFIETFVPTLTKEVVEKAIAENADKSISK
jgi:LysR family transcriptional regulator, cys regulon transcriptional activator